MIRLGNNKINEMNYADIPINKAYYGDALAFQRYVGISKEHTQKPCFAVVKNISSYEERTYERVFDTMSGKWYMLNNLGEYEEYGKYGNGLDITYYKGKLTGYEGVEYEWDGSKWVEVGEIKGVQILSPKYLIRDAQHAGSIDLGIGWTSDSIIELGVSGMTSGGGRILSTPSNDDNNDFRIFRYSSNFYFDYFSSRLNKTLKSWDNIVVRIGNYYFDVTDEKGNNVRQDGVTQTWVPVGNLWLFNQGLIGNSSDTDYANISYLKLFRNDGNELVLDLIPWTDGEGNYGLYNKVDNTILRAIIGGINTTNISGSSDVSQVLIGDFDKKYEELSDPENNIVFNSMEDALKYECPWVGMKATIGGDKYRFTEDGWTLLTSYCEIDLNSQWETSTSYGNIADSNNYEFYESFSNYYIDNGIASMIITIYGYDSFTFKVRNESESSFDYVVVNNLDDLSIPLWQPSQGDGLASNRMVYYTNKGKSSPTEWYDVTFDNLGEEEHMIMVSYGKDSTSSREPDKGYVAIPKY